MGTSAIEETEHRACEQKVSADPFGWKKVAVKKSL
jgi:hypothetical protein